MVVQKIKKHYDGSIEVAIKYYTIISIINNLKLPQRQIELLAFTAVKGNVSSGGKKEEFVEMFNSSLASIGNMVHKLGKRKLLVKVEGKLKVNPQLELDFNKDVVLQIMLCGHLAS